LLFRFVFFFFFFYKMEFEFEFPWLIRETEMNLQDVRE